eukprot:s1075_g13.t1
MSPKPAMMLQRRRGAVQGEEAESDEAEVLRGGETKALEDLRPEAEAEVKQDGQQAIEVKMMPERHRHGEFLGTPQPALEEGKTPKRKEEAPARAQEEWKTPKEQPREAPTGARSSVEGQGAQEAQNNLVPGQAKESDQRDPKWPGGPHTEPRPLRPPPGSQQTEERSLRSEQAAPLFNSEQLKRYEELQRQAPMLNPPRERDEEALQAMRPLELGKEELRRLQLRETELMREQEELKAEARLLRRMLAIKDEEERLRRERGDMMNPPGLQEEEYKTPEEEKNPVRRLFHEAEEADRPPKHEEPYKPPEEAVRPPKTPKGG